MLPGIKGESYTWFGDHSLPSPLDAEAVSPGGATSAPPLPPASHDAPPSDATTPGGAASGGAPSASPRFQASSPGLTPPLAGAPPASPAAAAPASPDSSRPADTSPWQAQPPPIPRLSTRHVRARARVRASACARERIRKRERTVASAGRMSTSASWAEVASAGRMSTSASWDAPARHHIAFSTSYEFAQRMTSIYWRGGDSFKLATTENQRHPEK